MEHQFWHQRWANDELGWQQDEVNAFLQRHLALLDGASLVLVPLCGKSLDLWYLTEKFQVVGAELSHIACEALFAEAEKTPMLTDRPTHRLYEHGALRVLQGDFFQLQQSDCTGVDAIYDRAALIALPETMRAAYVHKLKELCPQGRLLLLTIEYPQHEKDGPPFNVDSSEVHKLFNGCDLQELERIDISAQGFGRRKMKASRLEEVAWLISW